MFVHKIFRFASKFPILSMNKKFRHHSYLKEKFNLYYGNWISFVIFIILVVTILFITVIFFISPLLLTIVLFIDLIIYFMLEKFPDRYCENIRYELDNYLPIIRRIYNLYYRFIGNTWDMAVVFLRILIDMNLSIKSDLLHLLIKIRRGHLPEKLFLGIILPDSEFYNFIKQLAVNNFVPIIMEDDAENIDFDYKKFTKTLEQRFGIVFFIGVFYPIGLNFMIILGKADSTLMFLSLIFVYILLRYTTGSFIKGNFRIFGTFSSPNTPEYRKYKIIRKLIGRTAWYLKFNSPENAILLAYYEDPERFIEFGDIFRAFKTRKFSLKTFFDELKKIDMDVYGKCLLDIFSKMILSSASYSIDEIFRLISLTDKNSELEKERFMVFKAEVFKAYILSIIIAIISGLFTVIIPVFYDMYFSSISSLNFDNTLFTIFTDSSPPSSPSITLFITVAAFLLSEVFIARLSYGPNKFLFLLFTIVVYICSAVLGGFILKNGLLNLSFTQ